MMNLIFLMFGLTLSFQIFAGTSLEELLDRLDGIENDLLDVQLRSYERSFVHFSGELNQVFQHISFDPKSDQNLSKDQFKQVLSELRLNINKTDLSRVKYYSTFTATYLWNDSIQRPNVSVYSSIDTTHGPYLVVERAYLDLFFKERWFSLSFGRLPTIYGPPLHHGTGNSRMGTYPALLYSINVDGLSINTNFSEIFGLETRAIARLIYTPFFNYDGPHQSQGVGREEPFSNLKIESGESLTLNFEISRNQNWSDWLFILQAYQATFGRAKSLDGVRANIVPNEQLAPGETMDRNIYEIGGVDKKSTRIRSAVAHFELGNLFNSPLDLYTTLKYSWIKARGGRIDSKRNDTKTLSSKN